MLQLSALATRGSEDSRSLFAALGGQSLSGMDNVDVGRLRLSLEFEPAQLERACVKAGPFCSPVVDENFAWPRRGCKPRGDVHDVAEGARWIPLSIGYSSAAPT